jgi:hypothetical protein
MGGAIMLVVPLQTLPNQTLQVQLNGQACTRNIFQYAYGLFATVSVGSTLIVASAICENLVRLVRDAYLGFSGDLVFVDTQGAENPNYTELGSRWLLIYLSPTDLSTLDVVA